MTRFISSALGIASFVIAGLVLANHKQLPEWVLAALLGSFFIASYGHQCSLQGAQPLTKLKPLTHGSSYRIDAILNPNDGFRRIRLVVSWHVDWGYYEQRIVALPLHEFSIVPEVGDRLLVADGREPVGGHRYVVTHPIRASV